MLLVMVSTAVVVIDQIAKALVMRHLVLGAPLHIVDGFLTLRLGFNPGLAFGLLAGLDKSWRWIVAVLSIGALVILARVAYRMLPAAGWPGRLALGLVFGGAIGNLIDRARFGAVVDFIDVYWRVYHWPAFNTADSAITVGVLLLAATTMRESPARSPSRRA